MNEEFSIISTLRYDPSLCAVPRKELDHVGWNSEHESPVYLLDYHRDRLLAAASHWKWSKAMENLEGPAGIDRLSEGLMNFAGSGQCGGALRMRIAVNRQGDIGFTKADCPVAPLAQLFPRKLPAPGAVPGPWEAPKHDEYKVVIDDVASDKSEFTHFKTTRRPVYDAARKRAGISLGDSVETLLVSPTGLVMEGSITTPYFWREHRWVTPPVSSSYNENNTGEDDGGQDGITRRWALERLVLSFQGDMSTRIVTC